MTAPVRFALAGFGAWGKLHAQSIAANPEAELVAITAPSVASRAEASGSYPHARVFADVRQMVDEVEFDIIDIVTPSSTHREIAEAAMQSEAAKAIAATTGTEVYWLPAAEAQARIDADYKAIEELFAKIQK